LERRSVYAKCGIGREKTAKPIELWFWVVNEIGEETVYKVNVYIGVTWQIRLNDCAQQI